jgi:hypothetical protein
MSIVQNSPIQFNLQMSDTRVLYPTYLINESLSSTTFRIKISRKLRLCYHFFIAVVVFLLLSTHI